VAEALAPTLPASDGGIAAPHDEAAEPGLGAPNDDVIDSRLALRRGAYAAICEAEAQALRLCA
jgi:hypothetical protein